MTTKTEEQHITKYVFGNSLTSSKNFPWLETFFPESTEP